MRSSEKLIAQLKAWEGFTSPARRLPGDRPGVITGGYGDTDVYAGQIFTEAEADARLRHRVEHDYEPGVNHMVAVPMTQGMFDALVSFTYNVGVDSLRHSTLLQKLNAGDYDGAAREFARWDRAAGKELAGLIKRRAVEAQWFTEHQAIPPHPLLKEIALAPR